MRAFSVPLITAGLLLLGQAGASLGGAPPPPLEACAGAGEGWACGFTDQDMGEVHEGVCAAPGEALRCVPRRTLLLGAREIAEGARRSSKLAAGE